MKLKTCFRCNVAKTRSEFYRHSQMGDGLLGKCKECTKKDVHEHRAENIDSIREYDRERAKLIHRKVAKKLYQERPDRKEYKKQYQNRPEVRVRLVAKERIKRQSTPGYLAAHNGLKRAVWNGTVKRPLRCERCNSKGKIHGHHDDYTKPLDVMWLCPICHSARHRELGRCRGNPIPRVVPK